jgi:type II secretory pathway component GspD/PulD (secretin)
MSPVEALQVIDTLLAENGIVMVYLGTQYVKVVPAATAGTEAGPVLEVPWKELPESSSFITYVYPLKHIYPEHATSVCQPFCKLPNSVIGIKGAPVIILRDYSSNVRRMCEVLEKVDVPLK